MKSGEWVRPGDEYDDLEILSRGYTDEYYDALAVKTRRASLAVGGDASKIPNSVQRDIRTDCLLEHIVLGVRNLTGDDDKPVPIEQFRDVLRDPDYVELNLACLKAAAAVGRSKAAEVEESAGNFAAPSA